MKTTKFLIIAGLASGASVVLWLRFAAVGDRRSENITFLGYQKTSNGLVGNFRIARVSGDLVMECSPTKRPLNAMFDHGLVLVFSSMVPTNVSVAIPEGLKEGEWRFRASYPCGRDYGPIGNLIAETPFFGSAYRKMFDDFWVLETTAPLKPVPPAAQPGGKVSGQGSH